MGGDGTNAGDATQAGNKRFLNVVKQQVLHAPQNSHGASWRLICAKYRKIGRIGTTICQPKHYDDIGKIQAPKKGGISLGFEQTTVFFDRKRLKSATQTACDSGRFAFQNDPNRNAKRAIPQPKTVQTAKPRLPKRFPNSISPISEVLKSGFT